jgi:hypothetical protein
MFKFDFLSKRCIMRHIFLIQLLLALHATVIFCMQDSQGSQKIQIHNISHYNWFGSEQYSAWSFQGDLISVAFLKAGPNTGLYDYSFIPYTQFDAKTRNLQAPQLGCVTGKSGIAYRMFERLRTLYEQQEALKNITL